MTRTLALLVTLTLAHPASAQDRPKNPDARPSAGAIVLEDPALGKLREGAFNAAREGDLPTLKAYFEAKQPADIVNARGDTLLILAAYHGRDEAVRAILERKDALVDARNSMGFTALAGAAYKGYLGIVKQLVARGADLEAANGQGQTPLMFAAMFGRAEVVQFLVDSRADVARKDSQGRTALMLARAQGEKSAAVVKILEDAATRKP